MLSGGVAGTSSFTTPGLGAGPGELFGLIVSSQSKLSIADNLLFFDAPSRPGPGEPLFGLAAWRVTATTEVGGLHLLLTFFLGLEEATTLAVIDLHVTVPAFKGDTIEEVVGTFDGEEVTVEEIGVFTGVTGALCGRSVVVSVLPSCVSVDLLVATEVAVGFCDMTSFSAFWSWMEMAFFKSDSVDWPGVGVVLVAVTAPGFTPPPPPPPPPAERVAAVST
jgi:hypothetical protein